MSSFLASRPMSESEPQLDLTKIAFPSDSLTVKKLREVLPRYFDNPSRGPFVEANGEWEAMLSFERWIAELAFDAARGETISQFDAMRGLTLSQSIQRRRNELESYKEDLQELYVKYGLASGPHHVEQLVRDIETQAQNQAQSQSSPPLS